MRDLHLGSADAVAAKELAARAGTFMLERLLFNKPTDRSTEYAFADEGSCPSDSMPPQRRQPARDRPLN